MKAIASVVIAIAIMYAIDWVIANGFGYFAAGATFLTVVVLGIVVNASFEK